MSRQYLTFRGAVYKSVASVRLQDAVDAFKFIDTHLSLLLDRRDNHWDEQWPETLASFSVEGYAKQLRVLDQYLTDSIEARNKDRDVKQLLGVMNMVGGTDPIIYLSDGGYSRLALPEEAGQHLRLVRGGISSPRVIERWDVIEKVLAP